jgi:RNA polymerase sigma-70 factor (ECF subfamily)
MMVDRINLSTDTTRDDLMRLFLKNQDMVAAFLYSLVEDWELVEEAIQETTVYLCSHWNDYTPGTNFGAWIRTVARMRCREVLRAKQRSGKLLNQDFQSVADSLTHERWDASGATNSQHSQLLSECLKGLPESQRQIIEMYYKDEKSCEQIAGVLDKSIDALYMSLSRIRKRLKVCVERRMAEKSV